MNSLFCRVLLVPRKRNQRYIIPVCADLVKTVPHAKQILENVQDVAEWGTRV